MTQEHSISDDENTKRTSNDNEVLPELSDDTDKEDNSITPMGTSTVYEEDVDDPDENENHNRYYIQLFKTTYDDFVLILCILYILVVTTQYLTLIS